MQAPEGLGSPSHPAAMTTFPRFLTVAIAPGVRRVIEWNSPESYRTTSPGEAIRRHLAMYPCESPVAVRPA